MANEADRILALEGRPPAEDVNAADEVPCSTWYCARNHLRPMSAEEIAAGPAVIPPRLPLTILKGKDLGAASGYQVKDAAGRKFMLKFDIAGHLGMANAGEMIGNRIFHAAGYHVPGALSIDLDPADLKLGPAATYLLYRVQKRPITTGDVRAMLGKVARLPDGRIRAVVVPWIGGKHPGRVRHAGRAVRRSERPHPPSAPPIGARELGAVRLDVGPGSSSINTIDSYVEEGGRHFVRHYFFDFGCAFGSATNYAQGVQQDGEYLVEVGRTLGALFSLGLYRRPFQDQRDEWQRLITEHPALGYFPAETFDPDTFRTNRKLPSHMRLTDRDAYWGAKLVTAFSDEQIATLVSTARLSEADARYIDRGCASGGTSSAAAICAPSPRWRTRAWRPTAPDLLRGSGHRARLRAAGGGPLCRRGGGRPRQPHRKLQQEADRPLACIPIGGTEKGTGYRVVSIRAHFVGAAGHEGVHIGKATRVHLRWRESADRFVVVGLERDE